MKYGEVVTLMKKEMGVNIKRYPNTVILCFDRDFWREKKNEPNDLLALCLYFWRGDAIFRPLNKT